MRAGQGAGAGDIRAHPAAIAQQAFYHTTGLRIHRSHVGLWCCRILVVRLACGPRATAARPCGGAHGIDTDATAVAVATVAASCGRVVCAGVRVRAADSPGEPAGAASSEHAASTRSPGSRKRVRPPWRSRSRLQKHSVDTSDTCAGTHIADCLARRDRTRQPCADHSQDCGVLAHACSQNAMRSAGVSVGLLLLSTFC